MPPLKRVDHIVAHILLEHVLLRPSMAVVEVKRAGNFLAHELMS